jgi:hypothetical protein
MSNLLCINSAVDHMSPDKPNIIDLELMVNAHIVSFLAQFNVAG